MVWYRVIRGYVKQFSCGPTHIRNIQEPFMMWAEKWYCHIRTYSSLQCMVTVQYTIGFPTGDVSYGGLQFGINMRGIFKDYPSPSIHWTMFQLPLPRPLPRLCIHALISTTEKFLASFALKCSSWSAINQGTSRRAPCASLGLAGCPSVDSANTMASRTLECLWFQFV